RQFSFPDASGKRIDVPMAWREVRQILRFGETNFVCGVEPWQVIQGKPILLGWERSGPVNQIAISPEGELYAVSSRGLFRQSAGGWERIQVVDDGGRAWAVTNVLGVAFDSKRQLWFASKAGVGCLAADGWKFYEGKDGLPWNDFT